MWIRGSGSTIAERWIRGSGSGTTFLKCGSQDPDPRQNEMDPKRCFQVYFFLLHYRSQFHFIHNGVPTFKDRFHSPLDSSKLFQVDDVLHRAFVVVGWTFS